MMWCQGLIEKLPPIHCPLSRRIKIGMGVRFHLYGLCLKPSGHSLHLLHKASSHTSHSHASGRLRTIGRMLRGFEPTVHLCTYSLGRHSPASSLLQNTPPPSATVDNHNTPCSYLPAAAQAALLQALHLSPLSQPHATSWL